MPRIFAVAAVAAVLAGCAGTAEKPVVFHCLSAVRYSPAQERQAAGELALLPQSSELVQMMRDYGDLRSQVRACEK